MELKLLGNRILIRPLETEKRTAGGLVLVDDDPKAMPTAEVIKIGDEVIKIKEGTRVWYNRNAVSSVKIEGIEYYLISEPDILAIL